MPIKFLFIFMNEIDASPRTDFRISKTRSNALARMAVRSETVVARDSQVPSSALDGGQQGMRQGLFIPNEF
jgi:hypothetical protein